MMLESEVIYQITYRFCERCLKKGDRTVDQMVQAARSGKQNIVEGGDHRIINDYHFHNYVLQYVRKENVMKLRKIKKEGVINES